MTLTRRGLLGMFAAGTAAAIIRTPGLLMPVKPKLVGTVGDGIALFSTAHPPGRSVWVATEDSTFNVTTGTTKLYAMPVRFDNAEPFFSGDILTLRADGFVQRASSPAETFFGVYVGEAS